MATPALYTQARVAKLLGVSRSAVADRIREGKMDVLEIEGSTLVTARGFADWKAERARRARILTQEGE